MTDNFVLASWPLLFLVFLFLATVEHFLVRDVLSVQLAAHQPTVVWLVGQ